MTTDYSDSIDTQAGHQVYSRWTLPFYDFVVHGISNRWFWSCPTARLQQWFDHHATGNHLDVGVGTGFFLDRSRRENPWQRIALLDANPDCLRSTAQRIARHRPEVIQADLSESFRDRTSPFQSVSMMYVLHCLPGKLEFRQRVVQHCSEVLLPGGCLFGATILGQPRPSSSLGMRVMDIYNRKGVFGNANDSIELLESVLSSQLDEVIVEQFGSVAMFSAVRR